MKSLPIYKKWIKLYFMFCREKKIEVENTDSVLQYLKNIREKNGFKSTTLWQCYACLNKYLRVFYHQCLKDNPLVKDYLKGLQKVDVKVKAYTFEPADIEKFYRKAPNAGKPLLEKVLAGVAIGGRYLLFLRCFVVFLSFLSNCHFLLLIFFYFFILGACRCEEVTRFKFGDFIEDSAGITVAPKNFTTKTDPSGNSSYCFRLLRRDDDPDLCPVRMFNAYKKLVSFSYSVAFFLSLPIISSSPFLGRQTWSWYTCV